MPIRPSTNPCDLDEALVRNQWQSFKTGARKTDKSSMEKFSLVEYLLHRFGSAVGGLVVVASVLGYVRLNTTQKDLQAVWWLQEAKAAIELADKDAFSYLATAKSAELDSYNAQILKIGENFRLLTETFRGNEDLQTPLAEIQAETKNYFLDLNEKIQKKQSRPSKSWNFELHPEKAKSLVTRVDQVATSLKDRGSSSFEVGSAAIPAASLYLWIGVLFAGYCLLMHHWLSRQVSEGMAKSVSDLKIQSIILDGILNSISEAMIVIDEHGRFTRYNSAAERVVGKHIKTIATEEDASIFGFYDVDTLSPVRLAELPFARALNGEQLEDKEYLVKNEQHPQGMYISASSRYYSSLSGQIQGALVVIRDISRRKATEKEWLLARESALETARKKSDFLAAMSHEIRTPMNGVLGMATLLKDTTLNPEQDDYVGTIKQSAEALLRLINDILDHSKIEAGMVEFLQKPFDLKALATDVLELFRKVVREKNIGLELELTGASAWNFVGDPGRIRQILVNLIGNAVKFTDVGEVRLKIESTNNSSTGDFASLKFCVIDTGPGLNQAESEFLFQKYVQTKSGMKYGGTGLGLSICHQLVELMGGRMGLETKEGQGSTFWFNISLALASADQVVAPIEQTFAAIFSGQVLLAEDQIINQRVAVTYLQKLGLQVDVANNGQVAVEKALANSYDLIFMDCQMPVMTGYEATKKLRELETGKRTPIIALTAEGTSGERKTCIAVGMDDFLTKPLELEKLTEMLQRWVKSGPQVIDLKALEKLKKFVVNNKSLTDALIEDFLKTAPALTSEMHEGLTAGNLEAVSQAAHALKSCSATLGANALAELCQKIEEAETLELAQELHAKLQHHIEQSSRELQKHSTLSAA